MAKLFKNPIVSTDSFYLYASDKQEEQTQQPQENQEVALRENIAYQQGYLAGIAEENKRLHEELFVLKNQLQNALIALPETVSQLRLALNSEIAELALLITQQFFIEQENNPHALQVQINHILSQLNQQQKIELYMHPQELNYLQEGQIKLEASHLNGLKIKSDPTLTLGGYVIKTKHGIFDGNIEKQINRLKEELLKLREGRKNEYLI